MLQAFNFDIVIKWLPSQKCMHTKYYVVKVKARKRLVRDKLWFKWNSLIPYVLLSPWRSAQTIRNHPKYQTFAFITGRQKGRWWTGGMMGHEIHANLFSSYRIQYQHASRHVKPSQIHNRLKICSLKSIANVQRFGLCASCPDIKGPHYFGSGTKTLVKFRETIRARLTKQV